MTKGDKFARPFCGHDTGDDCGLKDWAFFCMQFIILDMSDHFLRQGYNAACGSRTRSDLFVANVYHGWVAGWIDMRKIARHCCEEIFERIKATIVWRLMRECNGRARTVLRFHSRVCSENTGIKLAGWAQKYRVQGSSDQRNTDNQLTIFQLENKVRESFNSLVVLYAMCSD